MLLMRNLIICSMCATKYLQALFIQQQPTLVLIILEILKTYYSTVECLELVYHKFVYVFVF